MLINCLSFEMYGEYCELVECLVCKTVQPVREWKADINGDVLACFHFLCYHSPSDHSLLVSENKPHVSYRYNGWLLQAL